VVIGRVGDALGGCDRASLEICTWRPCSCELGGRNRVSLHEYLEAVDERHVGCCDFFHRLVNLQLWECDNVTLPLSCHGELADGGGSCREARWKLKLHSGVNS